MRKQLLVGLVLLITLQVVVADGGLSYVNAYLNSTYFTIDDSTTTPTQPPLLVKSGLNTLIITPAGWLGVNTASPAQALDVNGSVHASGDICTDANGGHCLSTSSGGNNVWGTGTANSIYNTNTGFVGIGTSTPQYSLDVKASTIKLGLEKNGGGILVLGNNPADNSIYLEAFNNLSTGTANALYITGQYGGNLPLLSVIANNVSMNGNLGLGTTSPNGKLDIRGHACISDGDEYACPDNYVQAGSLVLGDTALSYGGGVGWNPNTAALILETDNDTEIAANDANNHVASLLFYVGGTNNSITIGRDMGWGPIGTVYLGGDLGYGLQNTRTQDLEDAGAMGGRSGFYEAQNPGSSGTAADWPNGATGMWHLLDVRHGNTGNNYAMQFAGSFFDQNIFFRKVNNDASQAWSRIITATSGAIVDVSDVNGTTSRIINVSTPVAPTDAANKAYVDAATNGGPDSAWNTTGINIYNGNGGSVGIGTKTIPYKLTVNGTVYSSSYIYSDGGLSVGYGGWTPPTGGALIAGPTGIGINHDPPSAMLEVSSPTTGIRVNSWGDFSSSICGMSMVAQNMYLNQSNNIAAWANSWTVGAAGIMFGSCGAGSTVIFYRANPPGGGVQTVANTAVNPTESMRIDQNGNLGINTASPTQKLDVAGGINAQSYYANGNCFQGVCLSDRNLKTDITPLADSLSRVMQLQPVTFLWKNQSMGNQTNYGLIAQDVQAVFPEWVVNGSDGYLRIQYGMNMQMTMLKALQEEETQIQTQQSTIQQQQQEINDLLVRVEKLEGNVSS